MGLFRKFGRIIGGGLRIGLGFATGGPTGAGAAAIREVSRGRSRRSRRRARRRTRRMVPDLRLPQQFQQGGPPIRTRRTAELIRVLGGGGGFGGAGAGGTFGALPTGGVTRAGVDLSSVAIAMAPTMRTVVMPRPGFVTVTLPFQAFGFPAGSKVQMLKEVAVKLRLHKRKRKPLLSAGDLDALRRAARVERKLVGLTNKHTDFRCVSKATRARTRARTATKKR